MIWMFLEVFIALFLLIGIVWWTLPTKRDEEKRHATAVQDDEKRPARAGQDE